MDMLERARLFVAVAETGSFTAAARRMGVGSGHASKLMTRLEEEFGVRLLTRTTRALSLTEVGRAYLERIGRLLAEFDALHATLRDEFRAPAGRVRLTAPMSFGQLRLMPLLLEFARRFPEIRLDVDLSDTIRNLVADGYDAAIRIGNPGDSGLMARRICDAGIVLVAAPDYLDRQGIPGEPGDLAAHACIVDTNFPDANRWRFRTPGTGEPLAVTVRGTMSLSDGQACAAAAEAGFGIARVPDFVVRGALAANRLRRVVSDWEERPFGVYALHPPGRTLAASVRALTDFLVSSLQDQRSREP